MIYMELGGKFRLPAFFFCLRLLLIYGIPDGKKV